MKFYDAAGQHVKTGPEKYFILSQTDFLSCIKDKEKLRLNREERLCLEIKYLKEHLSDGELDIIKDLPFNGIDIQYYRDGKVVTTAIFGKYRIKCLNSLLKYTDNIIETNRNI
jgi:antitoxin component YwqK of YwqJK toxin-antitoxin module